MKSVGFKNDKSDGVFFIEQSEFMKSFRSLTTGYTRNYKHGQSVFKNDDGQKKTINMNLKDEKEVFVRVMSWNRRMYAIGCLKYYNYGDVKIYSPSGSVLHTKRVYLNMAYQDPGIKMTNVKAGKYRIEVTARWSDPNSAKDFVVDHFNLHGSAGSAPSPNPSPTPTPKPTYVTKYKWVNTPQYVTKYKYTWAKYTYTYYGRTYTKWYKKRTAY